jgi:hypothetical protein
MADYPAEGTKSAAGAALTRRTGTAAADRVPAGSTLILHNTGAGTHTMTLTNTGTYGGLTIGNRTRTVLAGGGAILWVDPAYDGDLDGWVAVGIDGTAAEVVYYVTGL